MMRRRNKRGWMRILEATISVMIIAGVLLVVYSGNIEESTDRRDHIFTLQKQILNEISSNEHFRNQVLNVGESSGDLINYIDDIFGADLNYSLRICDLDASSCKLDSSIYTATMDEEVYVEETIISGDYNDYNPKVVKLFVW